MACSHNSHSHDVGIRNKNLIARNSVPGKALFCSQELCTWKEMPVHLRFNKFIQTRYRQLSDWKGCINSLFYLHNETGNILTHAPMAVYTLMYWDSFWPWESLGKHYFLYGLGICHTIAMVIPWIPSLLYHTFMSHKGGEKVYRALLKLDVLGIWMTECFGSMTNIYAAISQFPDGLQGALMGIFNVIAFYSFVKSLKADTPKQRVMCFAPLFASRGLAVMIRLTPWGGGDRRVLKHVLLQDFTSIVGGFMGVQRFPEKYCWGRCTVWLNSHTIMHLLVILAVYHMNMAANGDVNWILSYWKSSRYAQY